MTRSARVAALLVAAGLALTACTPEQVGAAAVIGDDRITVTDLQGSVDDFVATVPDAPGLATLDLSELQRKLLQEQISHRLRLHVAETEGIEVSEADVDEQIAALRQSSGSDEQFEATITSQGWTEQSFRDVVYDQLVDQLLGGAERAQQAVDDAAEELGVWVSPRYGTWSGGALQAGSGSLSDPVGDATPTAPAPAP